MKIAIPREIKTLEGRVGLIPAACADLVNQGHQVFIQHDAGILSGYSNENYENAGVTILPDAESIYDAGEMIVKVKEPVGPELKLLQKRHLLFSYLHLAAEEALLDRLLEIGLTAVAFETVEQDRYLPLLAPMSDIAGRLATQIGTSLLHRPSGGKGLMLGGLPGADRGHVVIVGGGVVGSNAAILAAAAGARVTVFDRDRRKQEKLRAIGPNVSALYPFPELLNEAVSDADLLIGAVLIVGEKAKHVVSREMVKNMSAGSVIIDVAVDQGGCIETTRPTTYEAPTFFDEDILHFGVTNMPGAVPRTSSQALSASLLTYVQMLAADNWRENESLSRGINVDDGKLIYPALKKLFPDKV